jgi:hypothetical protein
MPSATETIKQLWNILNFYPDFHDPEVAARTEKFILTASADQLFRLQRDLFDFAIPYFLKDERICCIMEDFDGRKVGLAIAGEYESTLIFRRDCFENIRGIGKGYPVFTVVSREAYRDGILKKVDPVKLVVARKIKVKNIHTLARWALPHWKILVDKTLFDKFLGYQDEVEEWIEGELTGFGF